MADGQQAKPSFKHAVARKALAPVVASAATAVTTYLLRKGAQLWQETVQPKLDERGGAEQVARDALETVSGKVAPVSEAVSSKAEDLKDAAPTPGGSEEDDRADERRKREQRRKQRRRALEQAGSS